MRDRAANGVATDRLPIDRTGDLGLKLRLDGFRKSQTVLVGGVIIVLGVHLKNDLLPGTVKRQASSGWNGTSSGPRHERKKRAYGFPRGSGRALPHSASGRAKAIASPASCQAEECFSPPPPRLRGCRNRKSPRILEYGGLGDTIRARRAVPAFAACLDGPRPSQSGGWPFPPEQRDVALGLLSQLCAPLVCCASPRVTHRNPSSGARKRRA